MAKTAEEWIASGTSGQSQPLVVFTGQQISAGFCLDPEAERWLGRAARCSASATCGRRRTSTSRFRNLASRSALVVAEDDAVGVLGETPTS